MEKRYQVFVSSTFVDLVEERKQVIQALLELDCFPAGMELFNSSDEDQWSLIVNVIDSCDYYIVIIGGRYGSVTEEGLSYTEKEFDYAESRDIPILAFLHQTPEEIPAKNSELDPSARLKLANFRKKIQTGRVVKYFSSPDDLGAKVSRSLIKAIKTHPTEGWVRGRYATSTSPKILSQLNDLRDERAKLQDRLISSYEATKPKGSESYAGGKDEFAVIGTLECSPDKVVEDWEMVLSWDEIFSYVGPVLYEDSDERKMLGHLSTAILGRFTKYPRKDIISFRVEDNCFQTIKIQLLALGLIRVSDKYESGVVGGGSLWLLTQYGQNHLLQLRAIQKDEYLKEIDDLKKTAIKKD